jgi:hypothetical protein
MNIYDSLSYLNFEIGVEFVFYSLHSIDSQGCSDLKKKSKVIPARGRGGPLYPFYM